MAVSLVSAQYMSAHGDYNRHAFMPQPPPSPPMDDSRCSLPSISKLLGLADAGSPTSESPSMSQLESSQVEVAGSTSRQLRQETPYSYVDSRPNSSYARTMQRSMPPTPPMGSDASFDGYSSPSAKSMSQLAAGIPAGRYYETTPPLDADMRRHSMASSSSRLSSRHSFSASSFSSSPPMNGFYQPTLGAPAPHPQISNLFYQQPLPQAFQPLSVPVMLAPSSGASPWQHHHYMTPSHGASFPQNQDRYICQTCSKAFSRPSSLRIHSHSHTGEKPFKCPHAGCGKAFSVRSNMKRHERGCHSFEISSGTTRS